MTKLEVMHELELLKDYTNDTGKRMIERLQCGVDALVKADGEVKDVDVVLPVERRSEERDPFEDEQKQAELLGLPVLPR